jgi:hypothetical protein
MGRDIIIIIILFGGGGVPGGNSRATIANVHVPRTFPITISSPFFFSFCFLGNYGAFEVSFLKI